ncbi:MAG: phosphoribosylformylglycinamidine synthase I [Elusimicrobiota bacterium]
MKNSNEVKVLILRTAGTNCDYEAVLAFKLAGAVPEQVHINEFISGRKKMSKYDVLIIPGGFSYGDDVASGKILANELKYKLWPQVKQFANDGKPVVGICNGFQVLVKLGLLPGEIKFGQPPEQTATLTDNASGKFECRWVELKKSINTRCKFLKYVPDIIDLPIAHGEGRFVAIEDKVLQDLVENGQIVFQYSHTGRPTEIYPYNPNGSIMSIAGITDYNGNILGMMPHPERYLFKINHPYRPATGTEEDEFGQGFTLFTSIVEYVRDRVKQ